MDPPVHLKVKKARRSAPKSRAGCQTCKIRHVKCDETRPFCKRCAKAGRKCEGYPQEDEHPGTNGKKSAAPESQVEEVILHESTPTGDATDAETSAASGLSIQLESSSNQDLRFLEFFYHRTASHISGFFDHDFYNRFLLQAGQHEPSIRYAMMACAAMHEHYEFEVVPALDGKATKPVPRPEKSNFALESYNKAICALMKQLSSTTGSIETVAMCCLLFVCLECLRGDPQSAAAHLRSGGTILAGWLSKNKTIKGCEPDKSFKTPSSTDPLWVKDNLIPIFQRLGAHVKNAGQLSSAEFNGLAHEDPSINDDVLSGFDTLAQARNSLLNLLGLGSRLATSLAPSKYGNNVSEDEIRAVSSMKQKFDSWRCAYAKFLESADETMQNSRRVLVLHIQFHCSPPILGCVLLAAECSYDEYMEDFTFIVREGERLLNLAASSLPLDDKELETFSFEEGISPACYVVASKCRDPVIRRAAIRLLKEGPARQGIWNSRLFAKVAERQVELEEGYMPELATSSLGDDLSAQGSGRLLTPESLPQPTPSPSHDALPTRTTNRARDVNRNASSISEEARIHVADIHESADDPHHHTVTFMSKPNGLQADWKSWTEDVYI